ncbi:MAG: response regulator [Chloroflexi bacterium]|nr:response regulator [Chloroflexota bacterium]
MSTVITQVEIRYEQDVVYARQRARLIAELLGFDRNDQTRISTAVSEIARNAYQYAAGGQVEFLVEGRMPPHLIAVTVRDRGPGIQDIDAILEGRFTSRTGMGLGILGARRLMDHFHIETQPGKGTTVFLGKAIPPSAPAFTPQALVRITEALAQTRPETPLEEIRLQNQELLRALEELRQRQQELIQLNQELEDTNRGVLALYTELDEKAAQLSRANELKARFLSNMSHELRTPLNSILALSRLLLDRVDGDLTEEQEKQAAFIRKGAEDLSTLVNDLLDLARIEAGKTVVRSRECSAAEIFSGLRGMLRPLLVSESLALVFEDPGGIPPLFTDDSKVSQILRNLLSNALKFTERGEIRVSARLSEDGRAVVFSVADTGIGIAPADQERIFEEYTQVEETQQGKPRGTGLGLPISKKLAEMLGGSVGLESRFGVGSTFFAVIPIQYVEPGEAAVSEAMAAADVTRHPVLVIEDDPAMHLLYEKYLRGSGFQALPARSIGMARQILKRMKPLAIVLDILMPGEDAWQFLVDVKGAEGTRNIPIIVVTVVEERDKGMALGAEDYCVKPVERKWLLDRLRTLSQHAPVEKVLIIDDEEVARYILKSHLADTKYRVVEAADGPQGLRLAEAERPDVIFVDLMMPGMSGFEVLHRLKGNPSTQHIPVIISTAKILDEEERKALNAEALAILSKGALSREAALEMVGAALRKAAELVKEKEVPPNG